LDPIVVYYVNLDADRRAARTLESGDVTVFCDSDDMHTASISYFAYVRLERR
jgi:hypothetical protein